MRPPLAGRRAASVTSDPPLGLMRGSWSSSPRISASSKVLTGVVSDGFKTMVFPAASAGAHFQTAIIIG